MLQSMSLAKRVAVLFAAAAVCSVLFPTAPIRAEEMEKEMSEEVAGQRLHYLLQTPSGEKPKAGWPLLLFLHGRGESGDDLARVKVHGPPKLRNKFPELSSCVIVSPQCPEESWWRAEPLKALVDEVIKNRGDIDTQRVYVSGLSMGGYGTWNLISNYPDFFAAAMPICGGGRARRRGDQEPTESEVKNGFNAEGLKRAKDLPIWAFHGAKDPVVPIGESERVVKMLKDAGSTKVKFTSYPEADHVGAWQQAYNDPAVWKWLFSQRKAEKGNSQE